MWLIVPSRIENEAQEKLDKVEAEERSTGKSGALK
jgi:hypothetical protein